MNKKFLFSMAITLSIMLIFIFKFTNLKEIDYSKKESLAQTSNSSVIDTHKNNKKEPFSTNDFDINVYIDTDSIYDFENVSEISASTDVMIKGLVVSETSRAIDLNNGEPQAITLLQVEVIEDFKGDLTAGQVVYFVEPGGVVAAKELEIPEKTFEKTGEIVDPDSTVRVLFDGVTNTRVGSEVVFFAVPITDDFYHLNLNETYYSTIAGSQGRFILNEDKTEFISPKTEEIVIEDKKARGIPNEKEQLSIQNNPAVLEDISNEKE